MALLEITVQPGPDVTHFDTFVLLDGVKYRFAFYTNKADGLWYFDIENSDGSAAVRGVGLSNGVDLLYPYRHLNLPVGPLWIHDKGLNGEDPDLDAFVDGRAALYYLQAEA